MTLPFAYLGYLGKEYLGVEDKEWLIESVDNLEGEVWPSDEFEVKVDHHIYADPQSPLYLSQRLLLHLFHHLWIQLWVVLCVGEHQLFSRGLEIWPYTQEVYCLDKAFVGEKYAEISNV